MSEHAVHQALRHPNTPGAGAKKRKALGREDKVHAVMAEFKRGTLLSSGHRVTSRAQAIAIAMSEAGMAWKKRRS